MALGFRPRHRTDDNPREPAEGWQCRPFALSNLALVESFGIT